MNENKKRILKEIIGTFDISSKSGRSKLIYEFNEIELMFLEYERDFENEGELLKDIIKCHEYVCYLYRTIIMDYIYEFSDSVYGQSLDYVLTDPNNTQENITFRLDRFLSSKGLPQTFKSDVYDNVKSLAERLERRFSFDEIALINLIEASSGNNIILEEGSSRTRDNHIIFANEGTFKYKQSSSHQRFTHDGSQILDPKGSNRLEENKIQIKNFPLGNQLSSMDNAMKKVMEVLFENLNLCIETYNSIYASGNNVVENTAILSNGTTFNFEYIVNEHNIPHLFGIPRPNRGEISQKSIDILNLIGKKNRRLTQNSSALDLLIFIYENQNEIIALGGLYEENKKKYEILNWEKVILKTTSFMKGDFFKTCFCLAKLAPNKYLNDPSEKGGYVSITSTEYNKGLKSSLSTRSVLYDLLNTRRQKRDFIFRGFKTDSNGNQIVNSIMTGKAETIHVGNNNELLRTLQRYRELFLTGETGFCMETTENLQSNSNSSGMPFEDSPRNKEELIGAIVEEIENEKFIRKFSPEEQAELGLSISRDMSLIPTLSSNAIDLLQDIHNYNGTVTSAELDEFDAVRGMGHNHKK